jgi:hypothetical protein
MLTVEITGDRELIAKLSAMPSKVHDALLRKGNSLRLLLEAKVKQKLSGEVLNVRTGALRRSIFGTTDDQRTAITWRVASSGDVKYAARWEFGFKGDEEVRAHTRTITQAFGREITPKEVAVRSFIRHVDVAARPFLRPSLAEMAPEIVRGLTEAVKEGMKE